MKNNPFILTGYKAPELFCNRDLETRRLIDSIENQRNLTLISSRRMGKTGLLLHTFHQISSSNDRIPVYFDILGTTNLAEFTEVFSSALLRSLSQSESAIKGFMKKLASLRPALSFDPLSGEPRLSLNLRNERETLQSLDTLFRLIRQDKRVFVVAIDEFQQIASYPEKKVEALLRSLVQQTTNLSFIFSGSKKHMLSDMFSLPSRPFFSSTELMFLDTISRESYFPFIQHHFEANKKYIDDEALETIAEHTSMHTFYVQFLCNRLFSQHKKVGSKETNQMLQLILSENEPIYASYLNLLTRTQFRVLRAIALDKVVEQPTSGGFISRHSLGAASTVTQAVESLTSREIIHNDPGKIFLQDKFLACWIRMKRH